jgi:hypothetical protein
VCYSILFLLLRAKFMFCAAEVPGAKRLGSFFNAAAFRRQASGAQACSIEPGVVLSFQVAGER